MYLAAGSLSRVAAFLPWRNTSGVVLRCAVVKVLA